MSEIICSACYKSVNKVSAIVCNICHCKLHKFCAKIDNDRAVLALATFANIVYNCDNCLHSAGDLVKKVNHLTHQIDEIKMLLSQHLPVKPVNNNTINQSNWNSSLLRTVTENASCSKHVTLSTGKSPTNLLSTDVSSLVVGDNAAVCSIDDVVAVSVNNSVALGAGDVVVDGIGRVNDALPLPNDDIFDDAMSDVVIDSGSAANAVWKNVTMRKQNKRRAVVGMNVNTELDVVTKMKWVHLSSFKPTVTVDRLMTYVCSYLKTEKDSIACYPLIKKGMNVENLRYVNFKLGVIPKLYDKLFDPDLWTANIKVRPFKFFPRKMPQPPKA